MINVVFDTVVFVRALINPYSRCGRLVFKHFAQYQLFVSEPVLAEIVEVLARPELASKFSQLKKLTSKELFSLLAQAPIVEVDHIPRVSRDPKDNKFLATALAADADYLVSEDSDLFDLKKYKGVKILTAEEFLAVLEKVTKV